MKLHKLSRIIHGITHRHRWHLHLDGPDDTSVTAAAAITCKPCRITRTVPPPAAPYEPCFCRDAACAGWRAYIARFVDALGVEPTEDDIAMDEQLHAARTAMIRRYGTGHAPAPFLAALALADKEVPR